jgi:hypothetical protein
MRDQQKEVVMQFRTRFEGELILTKNDIRTKRPVKRAETITFTEKTITNFGESIKANVKNRLLLPLDNEARVFVGLEPLAEEDLPKKKTSVSSPPPSPSPLEDVEADAHAYKTPTHKR